MTTRSEPTRFMTTQKSCILRAQGGDAAARDRIYTLYRRPVSLFLARKLPRGLEAEAEGITDEVMMDVLSTTFLARVDFKKGRFRDLLLAWTRHRMYNEIRRWRAKMRDRRREVALSDLGADEPPSAEESKIFARFYAQEVLAAATALFEDDAARRDSDEPRALRLAYRGGRSQAEIARELGKPVAAVNTLIDRARKQVGRHLEDVLRLVCTTDEEVKDEIRYLMGVLGSGRGRTGGRGAGKRARRRAGGEGEGRVRKAAARGRAGSGESRGSSPGPAKTRRPRSGGRRAEARGDRR